MKFTAVVTIETDTQEHADEVLTERLGPDEDYGFDYTLDFEKAVAVDEVAEAEWDAESERERQIEKEDEEDDKSTFPYNALRRAGATTVTIEYHGSGDEGWIEEVTAARVMPDEETVYINLDTTDYTLEDTVKEAAYGVLERKHPGWEINEGSSGTITIDVLGKKAVLSHGEIIETQQWEESVIV